MSNVKEPSLESNQIREFFYSFLKFSRLIIVLLIVIGGILAFIWYKVDYMPTPTIQISSAEELVSLWRRLPEPLFPPESVVQAGSIGSMNVDKRSRLRYQSLSYGVDCTYALDDGKMKIYKLGLSCEYWLGTYPTQTTYANPPTPSKEDLSVSTTTTISPPNVYPDPSLPVGTIQRKMVRTFTIGLYQYSMVAVYPDRYAEQTGAAESPDTLWILSRTDQIIDELLSSKP